MLRLSTAFVRLALVAAVAMVGCGKSADVTRPTSTPATPLSTFRVAGIATDDDGRPVGGASVIIQSDSC